MQKLFLGKPNPLKKWDNLFLSTNFATFLHLNASSLLVKIDKLMHIAKVTNASVIGISESKLDYSVLTSEIEIDEYELLCYDRKSYGREVTCYIKNELSYNIIHISRKL